MAPIFILRRVRARQRTALGMVWLLLLLLCALISFVSSPQRLLINMDAGGGGSLVVSVSNASSGALLGTSVPLTSNSVRAEVAWQRGWKLSAAVGESVRFELRMQAVKLYALRFAPHADK